jgi:hypothetical protein
MRADAPARESLGRVGGTPAEALFEHMSPG